ncbi:ash family protein [Leclercia adecarboxylata]|nr:ash family protein [Leclercia adecarboxylata]MBZ3807099.1 ash family protein [Leclercia adecarboxylata]
MCRCVSVPKWHSAVRIMVALAGQLSGWPVFFRAGISTPVSVITIFCGRKYLVVIAIPTEEFYRVTSPPHQIPPFRPPWRIRSGYKRRDKWPLLFKRSGMLPSRMLASCGACNPGR